MENEITRYEDDTYEIDLVDILAILLRFRKLIILGTLAVTFLAGLYFVLMPKLNKNFDKKDLSVTYVIKAQGLPSTISSGLDRLNIPVSVGGDLVNSFEDYPLLAKEYKNNPFFTDELPEDPLLFNKVITKTFQNKISKKKEDIRDDARINMEKSVSKKYYLVCTLPKDHFDENLLGNFVKEHVAYMNESLKEKAEEYIDVLQDKTLNWYNEIKSSADTSAGITLGNTDKEKNLLETLQDIQFYKNNPVVFYTIEDEPFVVEDDGKGKGKGIAMAFFASLFFFICLSFVKHILSKLKENPKLSQAWIEGK